MAAAGYEDYFKQFLQQNPDEFAARYGHGYLLFSGDQYNYSTPELTAWVHRFGDIIMQVNGAPTLRELREKYCTPEERARIEEEEKNADW
jgi:hypothetical protein